MSTFDTTAQRHDAYPTEPEMLETPGPGIDTLTMLGQAVAEQTKAEPETVEIPGIPLRLVCSTEIESKQLTNWQRRALPPQLRNASQVSPLMMDQSIFHTSVLVNTCQRVEVKARNGDTWQVITDTDGNVLTLKDKAVWAQLGALDSATAVKKMFARDSDLLRAGQQVLDAAGWTENRMFGTDEEDEDPT